MQTQLTVSNRASKFCHFAASALTTVCLLLPAQFAHADAPVNSNILIMLDDSFSMNSEVIWTAASGQSEFNDLTRIPEMFVNRKITALILTGSGDQRLVPDYNYAPPAGQFGAGVRATSAMYNMLAYDPGINYAPWPGFPSKDMTQCNLARQSNPASNTAAENEHCPKYFPEFDNTLEGNDCGSLSSGNPSANSRHCVPRNCIGTGCSEIAAISPTATYELELGGFKEPAKCGVVYTHPLMGTFGQCVENQYRTSIWGRLEASSYPFPTAPWPSGPTTNFAGCNKNGWTESVCFNDNGTATTAYATICYNLFPNKQIWPCGPYLENTKHTNILRKGQIESQYYVDTDGTTVVYVNDLTSTEKNNYANWFTYYRTRGHVMKAGLLKFTKDMGLGGFNERVGLGTNQWISYDPSSQWISASATSGIIANIQSTSVSVNKTALEADIAAASTPFKTNGATPTTENRILTGLDEAGKYYSENNATTKANIKYQYEDYAAAPTLNENDLSKNCRQNHVVLVTTNRWEQATKPTTSAGGAGKPTTYDSAANIGGNYYSGDFFAELNDKVPTNGYSANPAQHMKTWIAYFGKDGSISTWDASSPAHVAPGALSSTTDYVDDLANTAFQAKGGFYKATDVQSFLNIFDNDSGTDLLDKIRATNAADPNDCGNPGKRISWRELTKDK